MEFDYTELRKKIKGQYKTFGAFALAIGIPYQRLSKLVTGKSEWKAKEMFMAATLLDIVGEVDRYFFALKTHE